MTEMRCNMTFFNVMPLAPTLAPCHTNREIWSFGHVMHLMMALASSMVQLHVLAQDNQNEVWHDFWSCNAISTSTCITLCLQYHQLHHCIPYVKMIKKVYIMKFFWVMFHQLYWHWHHMMLTVLSVVPLYSLGQDDHNEVQHDSFGHVIHLFSVSCI